MSGGYRALVCVTSCRRLGRLRRYLPHYAALCADDPRFHLLVSLDGTEEGYLDFCGEWGVSLIHSDAREGVGIAKNRVLRTYPDFDFYFFVEDDAELVDAAAFPAQVEVARASGIHHFSLYERGGTRGVTGTSRAAGYRIVHGTYGGGQLSFFTRAGLERVGGWHPLFARWRRWGHTEHSHRFPRVGLAPAPFNVVEELSDAFIWHAPPPVSPVDALPRGPDQLVEPERALMEQGLEHVPPATPSPFHRNGVAPGTPHPLATLLESGGRYPLVEGRARRHCRSDYHLWRSRRAEDPAARAAALVRAGVSWPANPLLRHRVKQLLGWV